MPFDDAIRSMLREEVRAAVREELQALLSDWKGAPSNPDDFLSVKDAARVAHVCASTIRAWLRSGALKRHGTARLPRIRRGDLLQFMATQAPARTQQPRSLEEQAALIRARELCPPYGESAPESSAPVPPSRRAAPARLHPLPEEEQSP